MADRGRGGSFRGGFRGGRGGGGGSGAGPGHDGQGGSSESHQQQRGGRGGAHRGGGGGQRGGARGRGGGGAGGGGGGGYSRGGGGGRGGAGAHGQGEREKKPKENILDLSKYMDKGIIVKFSGGREVRGTLKGYDQLMNLVLDDVVESMRDEEGRESTRPLGLVVARGTLLVLISPVDGTEEIANPFLAAAGA